MSEFTAAHLEAIVATGTGDLAIMAESFNQCFGTKHTFTAGEAKPWSADDVPAAWTDAGLLVSLSIGGHGVVVAIPASFPLPEWISKPTDSENARLQTLAMEWGMNIIPSDLDAEATDTHFVENLAEAIGHTAPAESAQLLEWISAGDDGATSKLLLVFPVTVPSWKPAKREAPAPEPVAEPEGPSLDSLGGRSISPVDDFRQRAQRLFHLPVSVSVRLAEKKIPMGQLLSITPGALITFSKPCEDLLDLYINNSRYCRGEAVKIGEKFGLKVHEVGVVEVRKEKVL